MLSPLVSQCIASKWHMIVWNEYCKKILSTRLIFLLLVPSSTILYVTGAWSTTISPIGGSMIDGITFGDLVEGWAAWLLVGMLLVSEIQYSRITDQ